MKILLDTHILLRALSDDEKLPKKARRLIENEENEIYYSIVSTWEIEIKHLAHPEELAVSAEEFTEYCEQSGFQNVPVRERHIFAMSELKREKDAPPHKDPFDRMLICQAFTENMIFVTHDSRISGYNVPCILEV